jgi:hypothetical protein
MGSTLSFKYKDAIPSSHVIADTVSYMKILSATSILKTAQQIAFGNNNIPVSSAYQKH